MCRDKLCLLFVWGASLRRPHVSIYQLSLSLFPQFLLGEDVHEWGPPKGHADHEERNQKISTRLEEEEKKNDFIGLIRGICVHNIYPWPSNLII